MPTKIRSGIFGDGWGEVRSASAGFPDPAIHIYDTLSNDARWHEKADLILANPPFMTPKGGVTPHMKFRVAARKAEVLFTDYIAEHLTPDGRGAVIVPNAYVNLRRFLVEDSLVAVVSLPAGVFKPYSGVKTSILFLEKKLARQRKEVLFLKVTADGFDLGDKRTPVEANDLPEAERVVIAWLGATGIDPRYLFALLRGQQEYFASQANGAAIPGITRDPVLDLQIPLPPFEEQRRIVAEIEGYQKVIDGARQILAGYQLRQARHHKVRIPRRRHSRGCTVPLPARRHLPSTRQYEGAGRHRRVVRRGCVGPRFEA